MPDLTDLSVASLAGAAGAAEAPALARTRPNLLIIGAMKASTTLLYDLLSLHPRVWFPECKEPHFFSRPAADEPGGWESYLDLFAPCPPGKDLIGEASVSYTFAPHRGPVTRRIRDRLGQPRLIYMLRDPVDRAVSQYRHTMSRPSEIPPGETLDGLIDRLPALIDASRYAFQLDVFEAEFGPGSVHVMIAEELHRDPARVLAGLAAYLEIAEEPAWASPLPRVNSGDRVRETGRLRGMLRRYPTAGKLAIAMPGPVRRAAQKVALKFSRLHPEPPPVTEAMRGRALGLVADDLRVLRGRLGERIDVWPSVRGLGL